MFGRVRFAIVVSLCVACGARSELAATRRAGDAGSTVDAADPNAYEVAFMRTRGSRNGTLVLWHSSTKQVSDLASLHPLEYGSAPELSYDGRFVAVDPIVDDWIELRVLHADGTLARAQPLTKPETWLAPTLRPDGQRVLLVAGASQVETLDADGTRHPILSTTAGDFLSNGSYSPDGETIVATRVTSDSREEIDRLHDDGTARTVLVPPDGQDVELHDPSFAFDGQSVVFSRVDTHEDVQIELLDLASHQTKAFDVGSDMADPWPRLTPDGAGIVFIAWVGDAITGVSQELRRLDVASGTVETLWSEPVWGEPVFDGISVAREPTGP